MFPFLHAQLTETSRQQFSFENIVIILDMATGKQTAVHKAEGDDFPILCESCLGPNPYLRMMKDAWGAACKVCERPFTSFRWRPSGEGMRPKKTEVCQTCARAKNVCQTCLLDLEYGLPVQVRDASLAGHDRQLTIVPASDGTREYTAAQMERAVANGDIDAVYAAPKVNSVAERARRTEPRYERNRTRVCSFFLRGKCNRGLYCPYRHERPDESRDTRLDEQNLRDRYYGVNDVVAAKILYKAGIAADGKYTRLPRRQGKPGTPPPPPPDDPSNKVLFVSGVSEGISEQDVRNVFASVQGLSDVKLPFRRPFAFVEFDTRERAEAAMRNCHGMHIVKDARLSVSWSKGKKRSHHAVQTTLDSSNDPWAEVHDAVSADVPFITDFSSLENNPSKRMKSSSHSHEHHNESGTEGENVAAIAVVP